MVEVIGGAYYPAPSRSRFMLESLSQLEKLLICLERAGEILSLLIRPLLWIFFS